MSNRVGVLLWLCCNVLWCVLLRRSVCCCRCVCCGFVVLWLVVLHVVVVVAVLCCIGVGVCVGVGVVVGVVLCCVVRCHRVRSVCCAVLWTCCVGLSCRVVLC